MNLSGEFRNRGLGSELDVARARIGIPAVSPRSDEQSLRRAFDFREPEKILERTGGIAVVPAADVQHRDIRGCRVVLAPIVTQSLPVFVVIRVRHLFQKITLELRRYREWVQALAQRHCRKPLFNRLGVQSRFHCGIAYSCLLESPAKLLAQFESAVVSDLHIPAVRKTAEVQQQRFETRWIDL